MLQSQVSLLQDRVVLLEAKARIDVGIGTPIDAPIRTWDTTYGQSMADLLDIRRAAAEAWNEQAQRTSDGNWNDISNSNNN